MKIKKYITVLGLSLLVIQTLQGQSIDDALVFSTDENGASARIKAMGNAQTALGGDISSINGNPAGLGFFSRSDISITFNQSNNKNSADFFGNTNTAKKGHFSLNQAGVVFTFPRSGNQSALQNFNIGISYNQSQNFNNRRTIRGINTENSIVENLANTMNDYPSDIFTQEFATSNIVDRFANTRGYYSHVDPSSNSEQYKDFYTTGLKSRTAISFGANVRNNFYFGASLGITSLRYQKTLDYIENGWTMDVNRLSGINPSSQYISDPIKRDYLDASFELFDYYRQTVEGSGIDLKLGFIYKPAVDWNLGLTISTPTWTSIRESSIANTAIDYYDSEDAADPFDFYEIQNRDGSPAYYESNVDYILNSPWKFALGATKFFGRGLITTEAEFVTYNTMTYGDPTTNYFPSQDFALINRDIKDVYKTAANLRVGAEYLITNALSGRAGFNYLGNPYKEAEDTNLGGSVGLGYKLNDALYIDLSVTRQTHKFSESIYYVQDNEPVANFKLNRTTALFTIGAKF